MTAISIVNESSRVTLNDAHAIVAAVAAQFKYDFCPLWEHYIVPVHLASSLARAPKGAAIIAIIDDADVAGALGYHDETPDGRPYGRCFVSPVLNAGGSILAGSLSVSACVSHEALELAGDPNVNRWVDGGIHDAGNEICFEMCDPCEDVAYTKSTAYGDVSVSDFVLNAYFDLAAPAGSRMTFCHSLSRPWSYTRGGYLLTRRAGQVSQKFGADMPAWRRASKLHPAARSTKRRLVSI